MSPPPSSANRPPSTDANGPQESNEKPKKRPRIDLTTEPRERKRGKTIFGLVVGTLNKARSEEGARGASEAAKKRQLLEQRLQDKLRRETDAVRRAEEAKRGRTTANRKEEELQLRDSIYKLRRARLPILAHFLCTSDVIPSDPAPLSPPSDPHSPVDGEPSSNEEEGKKEKERTSVALKGPPRSHPPSLYYLPARLTPAQEAFLARRNAEVKAAVEQEWNSFAAERADGIAEIARLRVHVAEEEARLRENTSSGKDAEEKDTQMSEEKTEEKTEEKPLTNGSGEGNKLGKEGNEGEGEKMEVDDEQRAAERGREDHGKEETPIQADDDDAVEY
ncbi:hypothetical protein AcV5_003852 [Taiwanofungus camphoratus]|nr:hypothetical protein AcV5_003852 [Antrodia cinnamomea]KAI0919395.1 hypothetical protein AcV7_006145 [Antrodia cinnamomea]